MLEELDIRHKSLNTKADHILQFIVDKAMNTQKAMAS
jgi:hypothetical protein